MQSQYKKDIERLKVNKSIYEGITFILIFLSLILSWSYLKLFTIVGILINVLLISKNYKKIKSSNSPL